MTVLKPISYYQYYNQSRYNAERQYELRADAIIDARDGIRTSRLKNPGFQKSQMLKNKIATVNVPYSTRIYNALAQQLTSTQMDQFNRNFSLWEKEISRIKSDSQCDAFIDRLIRRFDYELYHFRRSSIDKFEFPPADENDNEFIRRYYDNLALLAHYKPNPREERQMAKDREKRYNMNPYQAPPPGESFKEMRDRMFNMMKHSDLMTFGVEEHKKLEKDLEKAQKYAKALNPLEQSRFYDKLKYIKDFANQGLTVDLGDEHIPLPYDEKEQHILAQRLAPERYAADDRTADITLNPTRSIPVGEPVREPNELLPDLIEANEVDEEDKDSIGSIDDFDVNSSVIGRVNALFDDFHQNKISSTNLMNEIYALISPLPRAKQMDILDELINILEARGNGSLSFVLDDMKNGEGFKPVHIMHIVSSLKKHHRKIQHAGVIGEIQHHASDLLDKIRKSTDMALGKHKSALEIQDEARIVRRQKKDEEEELDIINRDQEEDEKHDREMGEIKAKHMHQNLIEAEAALREVQKTRARHAAINIDNIYDQPEYSAHAIGNLVNLYGTLPSYFNESIANTRSRGVELLNERSELLDELRVTNDQFESMIRRVETANNHLMKQQILYESGKLAEAIKELMAKIDNCDSLLLKESMGPQLTVPADKSRFPSAEPIRRSGGRIGIRDSAPGTHADVKHRIQVLIGEKRAGNDSPHLKEQARRDIHHLTKAGAISNNEANSIMGMF
jgi:hypothetical protein